MNAASLFQVFFLCTLLPCLLSACNNGWFGSSCQYKCHCVNNRCDDQGLCLAGSSCERGWFGPLCQYQDLATLATITAATATGSQLAMLNDGDDRTCLEISSVTLKLPIRYEITSIRLLECSGSSKDLRLYLQETETSASLNCEEQKMYSVNDKATTVYCNVDKTVQIVKVVFDYTSIVCSININGGRNVALKQQTLQSSTYTVSGVRAISYKAVDGDTSSKYYDYSCTHTELNQPGSWTVTFQAPVKVNRYILYNRDTEMQRLKGFRLTSYNSNAQALYTYTDGNNNPLAVYTLTTTSTPAVTSVGINVTGILTLCEVEIFDGCPIGWFGPSCQYKCHCTNNYCDVSGGCYGGSRCDSGWFGPICQNQTCDMHHFGPNCINNCSSKCENSICDETTGHCINCIPGFSGTFCNKSCDSNHYGPNCMYSCSSSCRHQECNKVNGHCNTCIAGFQGELCNSTCDDNHYGQNCIYTCSTNCDQQKCDKTNGSCNSCIAGYQGDFCDIICDTNHYGPNCENNCSSNCNNSACEAETGQCFSCVQGYCGEFCELDYNGNKCQYTESDLWCHKLNGTCKQELGCVSQQRDYNAHDRWVEGIGIGIGIMCVVNVKIIVIVCVIIRRKRSATGGTNEAKNLSRQAERRLGNINKNRKDAVLPAANPYDYVNSGPVTNESSYNEVRETYTYDNLAITT